MYMRCSCSPYIFNPQDAQCTLEPKIQVRRTGAPPSLYSTHDYFVGRGNVPSPSCALGAATLFAFIFRPKEPWSTAGAPTVSTLLAIAVLPTFSAKINVTL